MADKYTIPAEPVKDGVRKNSDIECKAIDLNADGKASKLIIPVWSWNGSGPEWDHQPRGPIQPDP